jgi:SWI/SNF-related matrix-associated actin-dependent regulator 1 of chromatin subfamily A
MVVMQGIVTPIVNRHRVAIIPDTMLAKFDINSITEPFSLVIDEAHRFKSPRAKRSAALYSLQALSSSSLHMSGTPMPNRPMELYNALNAIMRKALGKYQNRFRFGVRFAAGHESRFGWNFDGASNLDELFTITKPYMLRHRREECLDLPPKTENIVYLNKVRSIEVLDEKLQNSLITSRVTDILKSLMSEHVASYRRELGSFKLDAAIAYIENLLESSTDKVIVYAYHKDVIRALGLALKFELAGVITGETAPTERQNIVDKFHRGNARVLLGNYLSMGLGLNIQCATKVVFVEYSWTPSDNSQAVDRCYRIGQTKSVSVDYLVFPDSLDESILKTVLRKQENISKL